MWRDEEHDDIEIGKFCIECKRRATIAVYAWLEQCEAATNGEREIPVVVARADGKEAIAILRLADLVPLIAGELGDGATPAATATPPRSAATAAPTVTARG